jgi:hypothetical protein
MSDHERRRMEEMIGVRAQPIGAHVPAGDVALLERVIAMAERALHPERGVTVPATTLRELATEVERARLLPANGDRVIDDEAAMLLQCLLNMTAHRADRHEAFAVRWRTLAESFLPFVRTDLACAQAGRPVVR